jgi:hypothetical protein
MTAIVVASTIRICEINAGSSPRDSIEHGLAATVSHQDLIFLNASGGERMRFFRRSWGTENDSEAHNPPSAARHIVKLRRRQ